MLPLYAVNVLYSEAFDKIYLGFTSDLNGWLDVHNHPKVKVGRSDTSHNMVYPR